MEPSHAPSASVSSTVETARLSKPVNQTHTDGLHIEKESLEKTNEIVEPHAHEMKQDEQLPASLQDMGKEARLKGKMQSDNAPSASKAPSDAEISDELLKYLQEDSFTMDVTERQLRNRLEAHFGVTLKDRKAIIRDKIMEFIETKQEVEDGTNGVPTEPEAEAEGATSEEDEEDQPVKKKRKGGGGLNASCHLSEALQAFLGEETMSRPQVVKALWKYIKENNLQEASNKRKIILDDKLATLFTKPLDMFSMNRQLSKHVKTNDAPIVEGNEGDDATPKSASKPKRKLKPSSERSAKKARKSGGDGEKKPSAFTRPLKVSPELSSWLGGETEISRPQLTKRFWEYAKENNLLNPENKKMIICDEALKGLTGEETFACFGFAKYFKKHLLGYADQTEGGL